MTLYTTGPAGIASHLFFNETINVIEEPTWFDTQLLGLYIIGLALLAGAGAWSRGQGEGKGLAPPAPHEIPTTLRTVGGTHYTPFTLPARPPPPLSPAAVYTAVEFARGKGWVKRSKPTARPSEQREGTWGAALGGDGGKSVRPLWCRFGTLRACHFFLCAATCFPFSKCCTALLWYLCRLTVRSYPTFAPPPPPAAAASSNKEEWLRGTAADPKLRKKQ